MQIALSLSLNHGLNVCDLTKFRLDKSCKVHSSKKKKKKERKKLPVCSFANRKQLRNSKTTSDGVKSALLQGRRIAFGFCRWAHYNVKLQFFL